MSNQGSSSFQSLKSLLGLSNHGRSSFQFFENPLGLPPRFPEPTTFNEINWDEWKDYQGKYPPDPKLKSS
ncbi:hypothetical protein CGMCC3_g16755 [Colletotrichum fructicola]|nr:uncharacterized protein CGMCC3_g16755 [Colletotrichum fructicola]KAE9567089.1 hypothetical protein CGMCC3_g16755 [Colletotrichum fructicola]